MKSEITSPDGIICNKLYKSCKKSVQPEFIYYKSEHLYSYKNSEFGEAFHTCLLKHNVLQKLAINEKHLVLIDGQYHCIVTNVPRYKSWYKVLNVSTITGEFEAIIKESDSIIRARGKLINSLKSFDTINRPLYRKKEVSCLFGTLTNVPDAKFTIRVFLKHLKTIFKRKGINLRSYIWCSEVKINTGATGKQLPIHWHYHFVLAIDRIEVTGGSLPECLSSSYLTELWGQRAQVKFIKGGNALNSYLSKYMAKGNENGIVVGVRRSGASRNITKR